MGEEYWGGYYPGRLCPRTTVQCRHNAVDFLVNIHKSPLGQGIGVFVNPASDWYSVPVPVIIYVISYNFGPHYNSTRLYIETIPQHNTKLQHSSQMLLLQFQNMTTCQLSHSYIYLLSNNDSMKQLLQHLLPGITWLGWIHSDPKIQGTTFRVTIFSEKVVVFNCCTWKCH